MVNIIWYYRIYNTEQITLDDFSKSKSIDGEEFVIGTDTDCEFRTDFCNGPLKPGASYYIKIRAYATDYQYTDTPYSLPIVTGMY